MINLVGKDVECHNMPDTSFYIAVKGKVTDVGNGWATVRVTDVIDRWSVLWEKHPGTCITGVLVANIELA